jgi:hypothetical protein
MSVEACSFAAADLLPAEEVEVAVDVFSRVLNASGRFDGAAPLCPLFRLMQVWPAGLVGRMH